MIADQMKFGLLRERGIVIKIVNLGNQACTDSFGSNNQPRYVISEGFGVDSRLYEGLVWVNRRVDPLDLFFFVGSLIYSWRD